MNKLKVFLCSLMATGFLAFSNGANAAGMDVSGAVAEITGVKDPANQIGLAVFTVIVACMLWKWLRRAL